MKDKLAALMGRLGSSKLLNTLTTSIVSLMPALMIGSVGAMFLQLPFEAYQSFIQSTGLINVFRGMVNVTTNLFALYAAFSVAYHYTREEGKDPFVGGVIALVCFLINVPMEMNEAGDTLLPLTWLGSTGLFTAMIVGVIVPKMYCWLDDHNVTIKLPDSVPPFINKAFSSIIPGIVISGVFAIVAALMAMTPFESLPAAIFILVGAPLSSLGTSLPAALLIKTLIGLCWWFGIHGGAVLMAVAPVLISADIENMTAIASGTQATNIVTMNWMEAVSNIGGAGCTLGLVLCCLFVAKSTRYKDFGKITVAPSLFGINEPVTYGMPCMLNPVLAVPYIFLPTLFVLLSYLLTVIGILPVGNGLEAPVTIPVLYGLINLGWRGAVWNVVEIVISFFVYLPFFKVLDKQALDEEQGLASETAAE